MRSTSRSGPARCMIAWTIPISTCSTSKMKKVPDLPTDRANSIRRGSDQGRSSGAPARNLRGSAMTTVNFKLDIDADGIALVTWDVPGRSMNVIDLKTIEELSAIVEKVAGDAAIKGAVITSGKETFCAGTDLTMLEVFSREFSDTVKAQGEEMAVKRLFEESRKLSVLYRRLEASGKPWVAAINGTALGGGFELCLACHHRVASDNPKTRVVLPGDALQFLLKGDQLRLAQAKGMKIVDEVVPPGELVAAAKRWIADGGKAKNPWDVEGFRLPGGLVYSKAGMQ